MIYGIFGLPRSGKTTYLCKIANKYIRKGIPVYTNYECKGALLMYDFAPLSVVSVRRTRNPDHLEPLSIVPKSLENP